MQPYVERKQKEKFFEGFTAAASGIGVEELVSSKNPINRIFGPTGYEQGAQFYTANTALDKFSGEVLTDIDTLKKLPPQEAARLLAAKSDELMTGDTGSNMLIQAGLMERMGPVMNTVAKARVEWQQTTAVNSMTVAHDTAADTLQTVMVAQAQMSDPTDVDRSAVSGAMQTFMAGRAKPEGMTDDSYLKYLKSSAMSDIQAGRFYSVAAMKQAGSWNLLDEDTQIKLEAAYEKQSNKASSRAALQYVPELIALETNIKLERIAPIAAAAELARINGLVMSTTGSEIPLFDYKDFTDTAGSVVDVLVAGDLRRQARVERLEDMKTQRGWQIEDREAEAAEDAAEVAEEAAQVTTVYAMGDITAGLTAGIPVAKFDQIALSQVRTGDFSGVINAYKTSKWVSKPAATSLQTAVTSSIGDEYNADVKRSHAEWASMYKANPAAAAAYYGDLHAPMLRFNTMLQNNTPQNAFAKAFGNPTIYHPASIPESRKKEVAAMLPAAIQATESGDWNPLGTSNLNPFAKARLNSSGLRTVTSLLTNRVATLATGDHTLSTKALVNQAMATATADGSIERYGAFAWGNRPGTTPLRQLVGLKGKEMDEVFTEVVDRKLKAAGYKAGATGADYTITRMKMPNGHPAIHIEGVSEDGSGSTQIIATVADFKRYQQHRLDKRYLAKTVRQDPAVRARVQEFERMFNPSK
ncbi:MAG: hypothetical protein H0W74_14025 [Sphingosinicella sp.]|nr:hypothetical protein [Sphingosinicella sp.]